MEKNWLTFTVFLTLILGSIAEQCPLLHAPEGVNRTGCYIVVLDSTIAPEKFAEILERATGLAEENHVYGLVQNVSKAFTLKLSTESLNLVSICVNVIQYQRYIKSVDLLVDEPMQHVLTFQKGKTSKHGSFRDKTWYPNALMHLNIVIEDSSMTSVFNCLY